MYQHDRARGCPDIWRNIMLGVSKMVFLMRLTFKSLDWSFSFQHLGTYGRLLGICLEGYSSRPFLLPISGVSEPEGAHNSS